MKRLSTVTVLCVVLGICAASTQLSVHLLTWNAGDEAPGNVEDLAPLLGLAGDETPDVIAIGMEELGDEAAWHKLIDGALLPRGYAKLAAEDMGAIMEAIYVKQALLPRVSNVMTTYKGTGMLRIWHNKGGVSIRFDLGGRSFVFVNCHLAAGQDKVKSRIDDYYQIVKNHHFDHKRTPYILDHDYVFWMGDLNFRVSGVSRDEAVHMIPGQVEQLLLQDQLREVVSGGRAFKGFQEPVITFPPTYKFDKGTSRYDTSAKQRVPSWTDRILYRTLPSTPVLSVRPGRYRSHPQYTVSDHKPVTLACTVAM